MKKLITLTALTFSLITGLAQGTEPEQFFERVSGAQEKAKILVTKEISIQNFDGIETHVAEYPKGITIFTALNGQFQDLQIITKKGKILEYSKDVQFIDETTFMHSYPAGRVLTYPDCQVYDFE